MTLDKHVQRLVERQVELVGEMGLERHGSFRESLAGLEHVGYETISKVMTPLDRAKRIDGEIQPIILGSVYFKGKPGKTYCEYHSHVGVGNDYPSAGDIGLMQAEGSESIIIAAPDGEDGFQVAEWRPKETADKKLLENTRGSVKSPFEWMQGEDIRRVIDENFTVKRYTLREQDGRVTFTQKHAG